MGESLLTLTLLTLIYLTIRRGKPVILDNPVIIQRPGQYHITLAPQLNRAQNFIEQIIKQYALITVQQGEFATQYFEVSDPKVFAQGETFYLLAVALREGVLYIQAINPQPLLHDADSHLKTVRAFSDKVMALHPLAGTSDEQSVKNLQIAIETAASQLKIEVTAMRNEN
jgi:hypothetical protein